MRNLPSISTAIPELVSKFLSSSGGRSGTKPGSSSGSAVTSGTKAGPSSSSTPTSVTKAVPSSSNVSPSMSNKSNISNKYLNHGTLIDLVWTISPALILILIA